MKFFISLTLSILFLTNLSFALNPEERLKDEKQEERAMQLFLEVRCLVCDGQVIENSNTEFSHQMRKLIRKKISQGQSNEEIKNDLKKEFGEDILTTAKSEIMLWLLPIIFAIVLLLLFIKKIFKSLTYM